MLALGGLAAAPARPADLDKIQALANRGRTEEALRRLESLLVQQPGQLEGRFLRGVLLTELGRSNEAEAAFRDLSREFPDRPEPLHNLAILQALTGRPATASVALGELVDRYPGYELAATNLERIRRAAAGDAFDPLSPDASRVQLVLTTRLGSFPMAALAAAPGAAPAPQRSLAQSPPTAQMPAAEMLEAEAPAVEMPSAEIETAAAAIDEAPAPEPAPPAEPAPAPRPEPEVPVAEPRPVLPPAEPAAAAEVTAAEPTPRPAAVPAPAARDLRAELEPVVAAWAAAWSRQSVQEYLGFYASDFQPTGFASREAWESSRRQRVATPSFIEVEIDADSLTVRETGPGEASVTFVQRYRSDRYSDTVHKTLDFVLDNGAWRIRAESSR